MMNLFEFLQEMAGDAEVDYNRRKVKGSVQRHEMASYFLEIEREEWLSTMDKENVIER